MIPGFSVFGLSFKEDVDVGHFLTFVTLVAGFAWWLVTTAKAWRDRARDEARSGALRLLLKLLRDAPRERVEFRRLFEDFQSDANAGQRRLYCGRRWKFDSYQQYETAIYRLHYEGKTSFGPDDQIILRTERSYGGWKQFVATQDDAKAVLAILQEAIRDPNDFHSTGIAETAMRLAPDQCTRILRLGLEDKDERTRRRCAELIGRFVPE